MLFVSLARGAEPELDVAVFVCYWMGGKRGIPRQAGGQGYTLWTPSITSSSASFIVVWG